MRTNILTIERDTHSMIAQALDRGAIEEKMNLIAIREPDGSYTIVKNRNGESGTGFSREDINEAAKSLGGLSL
jgi:hypothetical protein